MRNRNTFFTLLLALCCSIAAHSQPVYYPGNAKGGSGIPGTQNRNLLNTLERATAQGRTILTDNFFNQRWTDYVYITPTPVGFTPTPTGNTTNINSYVTDPSNDVYYIDWTGRSVRLYSAAAGGDKDWLKISDNQVPYAITDSIYTDNYAAINLRRVWPNAQLLLGDSSSLAGGNAVILGNREGRVGFYRLTGPAWSSVGQEGATLTARLGTGTANFVVQTAAGTGPTAATGPFVNLMDLSDGEARLHQYPNTRVDTSTVLNFLYTDPLGIVQSRPTSQLVPNYGTYVDDAAAATAGVAVGQLYYVALGNPYGLPPGMPKKRFAWLALLLAAPVGRLRFRPGRIARVALLAIAGLLVIRSNAQTIVGGSGACVVVGDPNAIATLRYQQPVQECLTVVDTVSWIRYRYQGDQLPGFRWVADTLSVLTEYPLVGGGGNLDPVRIDAGSAVNDVVYWDGTQWVIGPLPGGGGPDSTFAKTSGAAPYSGKRITDNVYKWGTLGVRTTDTTAILNIGLADTLTDRYRIRTAGNGEGVLQVKKDSRSSFATNLNFIRFLGASGVGGGGSNNQVMRLGFNVNMGGGVEDPTQPAASFQIEERYRNSSTEPFSYEFHIPDIRYPDGSWRRPMTGFFSRDQANKAGYWGFSTDHIDFNDYKTFSQKAFWGFATNGVRPKGITFLDTAGLTFYVNNVYFLASRNAANTGFVNVLKVDNTDRILLGGGGESRTAAFNWLELTNSAFLTGENNVVNVGAPTRRCALWIDAPGPEHMRFFDGGNLRGFMRFDGDLWTMMGRTGNSVLRAELTAPTNSLTVAPTGNVSIGNYGGSARLGIYATAGATTPLLFLTNSTGGSTLYRSSSTPVGSIFGTQGDLVLVNNAGIGELWGARSNGTSGWGKFLNLTDANGASNGQTLTWNGTTWAPATPTAYTVGTFQTTGDANGLSLSGSQFRGHRVTTTTPGMLSTLDDTKSGYLRTETTDAYNFVAKNLGTGLYGYAFQNSSNTTIAEVTADQTAGGNVFLNLGGQQAGRGLDNFISCDGDELTVKVFDGLTGVFKTATTQQEQYVDVNTAGSLDPDYSIQYISLGTTGAMTIPNTFPDGTVLNLWNLSGGGVTVTIQADTGESIVGGSFTFTATNDKAQLKKRGTAWYRWN